MPALTLTPEQIALAETQLAEAETALHQLMIGQKEVALSYNGESVTYLRADEGSLRRHINGLQVKLGLIASARRPGVRV